ncbi:hypothetical protein [Photobacterium leiognathi]|uniref:hypothetical protein n=1 Tax=Photobacterium leiognathi TaxID=553611 RepID=UPI00298194A7|nr:hypothetical protein [Photobacterium leiognathi]
MRVLLFFVALFTVFTGIFHYDGLMSYLNLDTARGTATPVIKHYFDVFTINAYYMSLSVKDYFVNIEWGFWHWLTFGLFVAYSAFDVAKRLYDYRHLSTDFVAVMKLPIVAIIYLFLSVFAPYRLTKIMDGSEARYDYEYGLMKRLGGDFYVELLGKSAVLRALVVSDLQATYLTDVMEIVYRNKRN